MYLKDSLLDLFKRASSNHHMSPSSAITTSRTSVRASPMKVACIRKITETEQLVEIFFCCLQLMRKKHLLDAAILMASERLYAHPRNALSSHEA